MKKWRVTVNGAFGNMGQIACAVLTDSSEFELVARLGHQDNLAQALQNTPVDMVVDLTRADCVMANTLAIIASGSRPVIGTSGLQTAQIEQLQRECGRLARGGLIVPNFSIAAVLMMQCAARIARYLPAVEIVEAHHVRKQDAPSATALKTADQIARARKSPQLLAATDQSVARGEVHHGVPIHSLRLPGIIAQQDVIFAQPGETITISHRTLDRTSFMPGLLLACRQVMRLNQLVYGLEHVLE